MSHYLLGVCSVTTVVTTVQQLAARGSPTVGTVAIKSASFAIEAAEPPCGIGFDAARGWIVLLCLKDCFIQRPDD